MQQILVLYLGEFEKQTDSEKVSAMRGVVPVKGEAKVSMV